MAVLRAGGLVGLPTETVYGLAALATNAGAVARIFTVKGRPPTHPLIVHLPDASHAARWASVLPDGFDALAAALWPGPLTIVVPAAEGVPVAITGGRPTVALRVPAHPATAEVLARLNAAVAAPSANRFGQVSPTSAADVVADLGGDVDLVLDGGPCEVGVESTIVDLSGLAPQVLRTGAVDAGELASLLGCEVHSSDPDAAPRAPGMLAAHYAPVAEVILAGVDGDLDPRARDRLVALRSGGGRVALLGATSAELAHLEAQLDDAAGLGDLVPLEPVGDPTGFAHHLYARFRQADRLGCAAVVAVPPGAGTGGIGVAVRDRLDRAATASGAGREPR